MAKMKNVAVGGVVAAKHMNQLIATANVVRSMSGNVIHTPNSIHIPESKPFWDMPVTYRAIQAYTNTTDEFPMGSVVKVVSAFKPSSKQAMYRGWTAYVSGVDDTTEAKGSEGFLGYAIVTRPIGYQYRGAGEIAIAGEVPALVKQPADLVAVAPGYRYAVVDANNPTTTERMFLRIYGKHKFGTVPAFRVLYEDLSGPDQDPAVELTEPHWALITLDMGSELNGCSTVKNDYTSAITDGQPAEIKEHEDGYLVVDRPSEDSIPASRLVFPVGVVGPSDDNPYGFARTGSEPIWVSYTGTAPAIGDEVGTVTDSFDFQAGNTGFMCIGVDEDNEKCLIRPAGGSGASIQVVQVTGTPSAGSVAVKNVTLKGDLTLSPNYELSGDAYSVGYYKE